MSDIKAMWWLAVVTAERDGRRWLLLVERADGHGWALPSGRVGPEEAAIDTAVRELTEKTGLVLPGDVQLTPAPARYAPDPRASDEAWMVTTPVRVDLGPVDRLPIVVTADDTARAVWLIDDDPDDRPGRGRQPQRRRPRAVWLPADDADGLAAALFDNFEGSLFAAHRELISWVLG